MFKMLSFRLYLIINKKDIQFVHNLMDSPSYNAKNATCNFVLLRGYSRISDLPEFDPSEHKTNILYLITLTVTICSNPNSSVQSLT